MVHRGKHYQYIPFFFFFVLWQCGKLGAYPLTTTPTTRRDFTLCAVLYCSAQDIKKVLFVQMAI